MWRSFNSWWRHIYSSLHGNRNLEPQSGLKICPLANQDGCPGVRRHTFLDQITENMVKIAPHSIWDQGRLVYPSPLLILPPRLAILYLSLLPTHLHLNLLFIDLEGIPKCTAAVGHQRMRNLRRRKMRRELKSDIIYEIIYHLQLEESMF